MRTSPRWSWVPLGIVAALLLSMAVAWSFRERLSRATECSALYAAAETAADSAVVDAVVVRGAVPGPALTCADLRASADRR